MFGSLTSAHVRRALLGCCLVLAAPRVRVQAEPPAAASEREVQLAELLAFARQHAPQLRVARARQELGRAARAAAEPWFADNPELAVALGPRWESRRAAGLDFSLGLEQAIEISGARAARRELAARTETRLARETELAAFRLELALEAAYRAAQLARGQLALADTAAQFAVEARAIVERRLAAGEATAIELRVAEGDAAQASAECPRARAALHAARLRLCELSGWPLERLPLTAAEWPAPGSSPNVSQLRARIESQHPELLLRAAELEAARADTSAAERAAWPRPALGAQFSREAALDGPAAWNLLGTLKLSLPIWQREQVAIERGRAEQQIARAEADASRAALPLQLEEAESALRAAAERSQLLSASSAAFADGLALLRHALEAGELSVLEVGAARRRLLEAQFAALEARADHERAWLELERAAGQRLEREP